MGVTMALSQKEGHEAKEQAEPAGDQELTAHFHCVDWPALGVPAPDAFAGPGWPAK
jgi:hypothetical protein